MPSKSSNSVQVMNALVHSKGAEKMRIANKTRGGFAAFDPSAVQMIGDKVLLFHSFWIYFFLTKPILFMSINNGSAEFNFSN